MLSFCSLSLRQRDVHLRRGAGLPRALEGSRDDDGCPGLICSTVGDIVAFTSGPDVTPDSCEEFCDDVEDYDDDLNAQYQEIPIGGLCSCRPDCDGGIFDDSADPFLAVNIPADADCDELDIIVVPPPPPPP